MKLPTGKIIHGDCRKILKRIPPGSVDLILTDPPYGIDYTKIQGTRQGEKRKREMKGDKKAMNFIFLFNRPELKIIFGAENFHNQIPFQGRWLCWDKRVNPLADRAIGSDFELAWISKKTGYYKKYRIMHGGIINDDNPCKPRYHPTQKPIRLMAAIIRNFSKPRDIILDPFVGSGTVCIAAEREGRRWIGIELEEKYCKIARKRIETEKRKPKPLIRY